MPLPRRVLRDRRDTTKLDTRRRARCRVRPSCAAFQSQVERRLDLTVLVVDPKCVERLFKKLHDK